MGFKCNNLQQEPKLTHLLTIVLFAESADFKAESIACDNFPKPPTASKMVLRDFSTPACVGSSAVYVCNAGGINKRKVNNTLLDLTVGLLEAHFTPSSSVRLVYFLSR